MVEHFDLNCHRAAFEIIIQLYFTRELSAIDPFRFHIIYYYHVMLDDCIK